MNTFTQRKINWRYLLTGIVLAIFLSGGVLWYLMKTEILPSEFSEIKQPKKLEKISKTPTIAGLLNDPRLKGSEEVKVIGKYTYVVGGGLRVIDISNPRNPVIVSSIDFPGVGISIQDKYAYIVGSSILTIVDISYPVSPKVITSFQDLKLPRDFQDIEVRDKYAYIIDNNWKALIIVDISDIKKPKIISSIRISKEEYGFALKKIFLLENYCYIVSSRGLTIIDISDPQNPKKLSSLSDRKLSDASDVFISKKYAYLITQNNILAIIDISVPSAPSIANLLQEERFWLGEKIYMVREYAYTIGRNALTIIDVSDPTLPKIITSIFDPKFEGAKDLCVSGRYGYIIAPEIQAFVVIDFKGEIVFEGRPIPVLSKEILELEEKFIKEDEREIAFFQNGNIWVIGKDLKRKYKLTEEEYKKIVRKEKNYWIEDGQLFKKNKEGKIKILVGKDEMEEKFLDLSFWKMESFSYLKGKVLNFSLSTDKEYIAYETLEGYTGCCLAPPTFPVTSIWIMKNDGTGKVEIEKPPLAGEVIEEWGWIPNTHMIFTRLTEPDAGFPPPFYKFGIDGKCLGSFEGLFPLFSPDGTKMAYLDAWEKEVGLATLKKGEVKEKKVILKDKIPFVGSPSRILQWSEDGNLLLVRGVEEVFLFDSKGEIVFKQRFPDAEEIENVILSPDNKYLGGIYLLKKERVKVFFFINLLTKEKKEFKFPKMEDYSGTISIYPQFFSKENRFYYLIEVKKELKNKPHHWMVESFQLWVVDVNTWKNYKIAENVSHVIKIP